MYPLISPPDEAAYARTLMRGESMRDPDRLFRDELLRPDPVFMALRKAGGAIRRALGFREDDALPETNASVAAIDGTARGQERDGDSDDRLAA